MADSSPEVNDSNRANRLEVGVDSTLIYLNALSTLAVRKQVGMHSSPFRRHDQANPVRLLALNLPNHRGYWGGEVAGQRLNGYLQPEIFTFCLEEGEEALLTQARLRLDPNENTNYPPFLCFSGEPG